MFNETVGKHVKRLVLIYLIVIGGIGLTQTRMISHLTRAEGGFGTEIIISNPTSETGTYSFKVFDINGGHLMDVDGSIPGKSTFFSSAKSLLGASASHFGILTSADISVAVAYRAASGISGPAHVLESDIQSKTWRLFPGLDEVTWDGVAVVNTGDTNASVVIRQLDSEGTIIEQKNMINDLAPHGKGLYVISGNFQNLSETIFEISSDQPLAITALRGEVHASSFLWENRAFSVSGSTGLGYNLGKNYFTTESGGDTREYFVHVPSIYDPNVATPVVFMLHGTSGFGERFYNHSGWKEVGEAENIITVYPSSWHYCIVDDGETKHTTKWNVYPGSYEYCEGENPRDDIAFLRQIIGELKEKFFVDNSKMYLVGFSNGGQMAGRCAVEMSDVFAAIVESAGTLPKGEVYTPERALPMILQVGNSDDAWTGDPSVEIDMASFETLLSGQFSGIVSTHTNTLGLNTTYTMSGDVDSSLTATYQEPSQDPHVEFKFVLIKGLEHNYPNGINHPLKGAEVNWNWMKQFSLP